ncbi:regulatory protein [Chitinophaga costaii]|uniref:Regulatory protein RecX n=1 Tax=Chitinophaga costaii TaxID=1335309 RepID=A0A1C4FQF7_9BACT|nr:regulatory protein RecX [Chitinophaga costaii]PUZ20438.1 RecX family transcriptional regulator [Chitinophaga costaii]SCC57893.1 regulatory protein [Chitinophaga costaii]
MDTAILQLRNYCAYQERCHSEVRQKCLELGLRGDAIDQAIVELISEDFLNEERFAIAFAGGKFRMQQWGRKKIAAALQQLQVAAYCIKKGLLEIEDADYQATLHKLARKKFESLQREPLLRRKQKTWAYLAQKGYEPGLVAAVVEQLTKEDD